MLQNNLSQQQGLVSKLTDPQLALELKNPSGLAPSFLIMSEMQKRQQMRQGMAGAAGPDSRSTVRQQMLQQAGMLPGAQQPAQQQLPTPPMMPMSHVAPPAQGGMNPVAPQPIQMPGHSPMPNIPQIAQRYARGGEVRGYAPGGGINPFANDLSMTSQALANMMRGMGQIPAGVASLTGSPNAQTLVGQGAPALAQPPAQPQPQQQLHINVPPPPASPMAAPAPAAPSSVHPAIAAAAQAAQAQAQPSAGLSPQGNPISGGSGIDPTTAVINQYHSFAAQEAARYGIPEDVYTGLISTESGWHQNGSDGHTLNANAHDPRSHAMGLMQLEPGTAKMLGGDPNDPYDNIRMGMKYLSEAYAKTGNWRDAVALYHEGLNGNPNSDTANKYVASVFGRNQGVGNTSPGAAAQFQQMQQALGGANAPLSMQEYFNQEKGLVPNPTGAYNEPIQALRDQLNQLKGKEKSQVLASIGAAMMGGGGNFLANVGQGIQAGLGSYDKSVAAQREAQMALSNAQIAQANAGTSYAQGLVHDASGLRGQELQGYNDRLRTAAGLTGDQMRSQLGYSEQANQARLEQMRQEAENARVTQQGQNSLAVANIYAPERLAAAGVRAGGMDKASAMRAMTSMGFASMPEQYKQIVLAAAMGPDNGPLAAQPGAGSRVPGQGDPLGIRN